MAHASYHENPTVLNCSFVSCLFCPFLIFQSKKQQQMSTQIDMCLDYTGQMKIRYAPFLRTSPRINFIKIVIRVCSTSKSKERCQLSLAKRRQSVGVSRSSRVTQTVGRTLLIHEASLVVTKRKKEKHFHFLGTGQVTFEDLDERV